MSDLIKTRNLPELIPAGELKSYSADSEDSASSFDAMHYLLIISKRRWLIAAIVFTVFVGVAVEVFTMTPTYRATVRIQIDPENANILPYQEVHASNTNFLASETYLRTQHEVLSSNSLAKRVVRTLSLGTAPVFNTAVSNGFISDRISFLKNMLKGLLIVSPEEAVGGAVPEDLLVRRFLNGMEVLPIPATRLVGVSFQSHDAEFAAQAVNKLADEYIEYNLESKYEATRRAASFLQGQLMDLKVRVEKSEEELLAYARAHGILNIGDRQNLVQKKLADLSTELTRVEADLISKSAYNDAIKGSSAENFPDSLKNATLVNLEQRAFQLREKLANLSARFGNEWPDVIQVQNEINQADLQIQLVKDLALKQAETNYEIAVEHRQMLMNAFERQKILADHLNENSIQYNIIAREVGTNKELYEGLLQRLKQAGISAGLRSSNVNIVDYAEIPRTTFAPRKTVSLGLGLILGFVLAVGVVFLAENLDKTIKTPDQAEALLTLPSLGVIPKMENGLGRLLLPAEGGVDQEGPVTINTDSKIWEAYRSLRTSILLSCSGQQPQIMLVTSTFSGEGKTTTASNTAIVFSQTGARTLLIELDMRKPRLANEFGLSKLKGMSSFLSGNSDLTSQIQKTKIPNLSLLTSGPIPPNPAELIGSERMSQALGILSQHFKYIIIDSPPVLSVTDARLLTSYVDGVILVVHGGKTNKNAISRASVHLQQVGAKVLGTLINNVNVESPEYSYYYNQYYDYQYYSQDEKI
jgi:capsular exopolysaccharide synthesis family protein